MDKISGWELVAAFSLVGVLLIAILIVLLTLLLSNVVKNKIISNKGAKNWVKQTPSTYKNTIKVMVILLIHKNSLMRGG